MTTESQYDAMFSGLIGQDYQMLKLICPFAVEMSRQVAAQAAEFCAQADGQVKILELGGGTGITTLSLLSAAENSTILSVDNEPTMQNQAKQNLRDWTEQGRLAFSGADALTALRDLPDNCMDVLASAYTFHNFPADYRRQVLQESCRVLKSGGRFINGDRYALDDIVAHTRNTQNEVANYFKVLTGLNRLDLLEHWIIHLFNDESENHIMRESTAVQQMAAVGFQQIELHRRQDVNALVTAFK